MIMRDLLESVDMERRKKKRVKVARKLAVGMGVVAAVGVATVIIFCCKIGKGNEKS